MLLTRAPLASGGGRNLPPDAARLACVKPAASVHPEPGSNSPLLNIYFSIYLRIFVCPASLIIRMMFFLTETLSLPRVPLSLLRLTRGSALLVLWHHVIVLNLFAPGTGLSAGRRTVCFPIADAKLLPFSTICKFF